MRKEECEVRKNKMEGDACVWACAEKETARFYVSTPTFLLSVREKVK